MGHLMLMWFLAVLLLITAIKCRKEFWLEWDTFIISILLIGISLFFIVMIPITMLNYYDVIQLWRHG